MNYQNDDSSNDSSFGTLIINNSVKNESDKDASFNISLDSNGSIDSTANVDSNSTCASNDSSNASSNSSSNSSKYSRTKRKSHKRSKWWNYFTLIENIKSDQLRSRCIVCNDEIASSGNTKNFATHFKIHHPNEYEKIEGKFFYHVEIIFIFKM